MADDEEYVQVTMPEVFVYKIPPKTTAAGHKAADWGDQVWVGKLQVVTRGGSGAVKLVTESGSIFAVAPLRHGEPLPVDKVSDSSRYFVLRIENDKGARAFIGIGFNNRSDAFDFNVAVSDVMKELSSGATGSSGLDLGPDVDLSLKAGQTFTIKVNIDGKGKKAGATPGTAAAAPSGAPSKLAPPGSGMPRLRAPGASTPAPAPAASAAAAAPASDDLLGLGSGMAAMHVSVPAPAPAPAATPASSWEPF